VSNPPATAAPGASFTGSDTVKNQGAAAAGASTTRFYLSADRFKDAADTQMSATRSVAGLAAGATSSGNVTLAIPSTIAAGAYYLLACANDLNAVSRLSRRTTASLPRPRCRSRFPIWS
jgi:hypothetical protein